MKNKIRINVNGVVSAYHSIEFLKQAQKYLGKNIGILNGGGDVSRVADAKAQGRIRSQWYELAIEFQPEREQHLGAYTERECPFQLVAKTTERNAARMQELIDSLPPPSRFGGYVSGTEIDIT